jgi:radical SAM superfamily enzyme YgiQ (UPF0313 family)
MRIALISPPLIGYRRDPFGHIPSIPLGLLHVAAAVGNAGHDVTVLDAFGLAPGALHPWHGEFQLTGLLPGELASRLPRGVEVAGLSLHSGASHRWSAALIDELTRRKIRIVAGGPFAASAPGLLLAAGAREVVVGDGERALTDLLGLVERDGAADTAAIPGVATIRRPGPQPDLVDDLDALPAAAFDTIDLEPYWTWGRAHAPLIGPYLPLVTSRGCTGNCAFCGTPALSGRRWRARSPEGVVREVCGLRDRFGVADFHFQDDSFASSPDRTARLAGLLAALPRPVTFALPSAVRVGDLTEDLVDGLCAAGLRYLAFSPESGSARVRRSMGKAVDADRLLRLVAHSAARDLPTQACFVAGFPGEDDDDRRETRALIAKLADAGLDDLSLFVMAPVPGSRVEGVLGPVPHFEGLCWSPRWRPDWEKLARFRRRAYAGFFARKSLRHPWRTARSASRALRGRYRTKSEMYAGWLLRSPWRKP